MHTVWLLKIALQLVHIAYVVLASLLILGPGRFFSIPPLWPALLVPFPVASNLWHYLLIKRASPDVANPTQLVTSRGLYRLVRHPMYLGDILVVIFLSLMWLNGVTIGIGVLAIAAILCLARLEDRELRERFGATHAEWFVQTDLVFPTGAFR